MDFSAGPMVTEVGLVALGFVTEFATKLNKRTARQRLGKYIGELLRRRDMLCFDENQHDLLTDVVKVSIEVLRSAIESWISIEVNSGEVVAVENYQTVLWDVEISEKDRQPCEILCSRGESSVLCLCR